MPLVTEFEKPVVQLIRNIFKPYATLGLIKTPTFQAYTIELPYVNNLPDISCIPTGTYDALWQLSARFKMNTYHIQNVLNRNYIEIHPANIAEELLGCIALGSSIQTFSPGSIRPNFPESDCLGVVNSIEALYKFEASLRDKNGNQLPFSIQISDEN